MLGYEVFERPSNTSVIYVGPQHDVGLLKSYNQSTVSSTQ